MRRICAQSAGVAAVNEVLREAGGKVRIEDVLPLFPDFVTIDAFKAAICASLEDYNSQIERLKGDMADATRIADALRCASCRCSSMLGFGLPRCYIVIAQGQSCCKCPYPTDAGARPGPLQHGMARLACVQAWHMRAGATWRRWSSERPRWT